MEAVRGIGTFAPAEIELGRVGALWLRVRVLARRDHLTRQIAEGAELVETRELALRARQLISPHNREALARSYDDLLARAQRKRPLVSSQVPIDRGKVNAVRDELTVLAERLRSPAPLRAQCVARALLLLTDPALPLHGVGDAEGLRGAIIDSEDDW
jgi:hypothetical protein